MTDTAIDSPVGWGEVLNSRHVAPLLLVSLGVWLHAADGLLLATMIPRVLADIGGDAFVAWTIATYEIGSIVAGASAAITSLRFGVRRPMGICALTFALGCAISMLAPTMHVLLAGRVLQGLGGGGLVALTFIAINLLFPARLAPRIMAVISALWGASAFLGPLIGAFFVEYATWRWGFGAFLAQALVLALWIFLARGIDDAPDSTGESPGLPLRRLALLTLGVFLIASAGIDVSPTRTPILIVTGVVALALFLRLDGMAEANRMLPRGAFRLSHPAGAALLMWTGLAIGVMGLSSYGPVLLAGLHDAPPVVIGYVLAGASIGWSGAAIVVSGSPERLDRHWIIGGVSLVVLSVMGLLIFMPIGPVWMVALLSVAEGIGFGSAYTFILRRVKAVSPPAELARTSGALPTVGRFGLAAGAALCGIYANAAGFSAEANAETLRGVARAVFAGCLPFAALGLLGMWGFVRKAT